MAFLTLSVEVVSYRGSSALDTFGWTSRADTGRGFFTIEYCDEADDDDVGSSLDGAFRDDEDDTEDLVPIVLSVRSDFDGTFGEADCSPALADEELDGSLASEADTAEAVSCFSSAAASEPLADACLTAL